MRYTVEQICRIVQGSFIQQSSNDTIDELVFDSRRITYPHTSIFFALITKDNDGHRFLEEVYGKGVRNFIISAQVTGELPGANIIRVNNTLDAMQLLAAFHRSQFQLPVIGITGSNGKTIVKEWLYLLLQDDYNIVRSPKSYNSQLGVPLSVWQVQPQHTLGIFEAGISNVGEMEKLEKIIRPSIGILTNIGEAHDAGFISRKQKAEEKIRLFRSAGTLIYCREEITALFGTDENVFSETTEKFSWSYHTGADLYVSDKTISQDGTFLKASFRGNNFELQVHFTDEASIQNIIHCWCLLIWLGIGDAKIREKFSRLHRIEMRMQLLHAINDCILINDSYSADLTSLQTALQFQQQQSSGLTKTVILSDFYETGKEEGRLYGEILELLTSCKVNKIIGIGEKISYYLGDQLETLGNTAVQTFRDVAGFRSQFKSTQFQKEIILIKGSRIFHLEQIAALFEIKKHQTVLEINFNALVHNLKEYRKLLQPGTKVMAMVKAFSYGSGTAEIASVLQFNKVDFLAVAYADEGVELVNSGISTPVMVMNTEPSSFASIVDNNLQPVIYSFNLLRSFEAYIDRQGLKNYPVHIEIETGMNRLGFQANEVESLAGYLSNTDKLHVISVFTHLAASEDPQQDDFTMDQFRHFNSAVDVIKKQLSYPFLQHMANSAAVVRHPQLHLDMVRIGIGLYGIETDPQEKLDLLPVASLISTIAQVKEVPKGGSVSYNRRGVVARDSKIATIRIGYADGYSRQFSNGRGKMMVRGHLVPVIGSVCMDMTMVDVTDVAGVREGDEVTIFGGQLPVQQVAGWIGTIPYEILTSVSQRVKRVYFHD